MNSGRQVERTMVMIEGDDRAGEIAVEADLLEGGLRHRIVPHAKGPLGAVVVPLDGEARRVGEEPRVLRLDEILAETVRLLRRERVEGQIAVEGGFVGRQVRELRPLVAGEARQLEKRSVAPPRRAEIDRPLP